MKKKILYCACHHHEYGASFKLFRSDHFPAEEEVASHFDFEPDLDEWIDIDGVDENEIVELPPEKKKKKSVVGRKK